MRKAVAHTANVKAFIGAVNRAGSRGAPEAGITLVTGEAGFGKTRTVIWWGSEKAALYVCAKAAWTPHWFLAELCAQLGIPARGTTEQLYAHAVGTLMKRPDTPLIVDEIEHCLRDTKVIETIRDVTDMVQCPAVFVGMEAVPFKLNRLPQIASRIAAAVSFGPATEACVRTTCDAICEIKVADDLVAEIHRQSGGRMREVLNAIATVERAGKRGGGGKVALADVAGIALTNELGARKLRLVKAEPAAGAARA